MRRSTMVMAALSLLALGCTSVKQKDVDDLGARLTTLEASVKALAATQDGIAQKSGAIEARLASLKGELEAVVKDQADRSGKRIDSLASADGLRAKAVDEKIAKLESEQANLRAQGTSDLQRLKEEMSKMTVDLVAQAQAAAKASQTPASTPPAETKIVAPATQQK
jgi:chromosome segregation ATPase